MQELRYSAVFYADLEMNMHFSKLAMAAAATWMEMVRPELPI